MTTSVNRALLFGMPVSLVAGLLSVTAPATPAVAAPAAAVSCPDELPDEHAALITARMCHGDVGIAGLTSATDRAVATPNGTVRLEHNFRPVRIKQGNVWKPIDTTLSFTADGRVAPKAAAAAVTFSAGGTAPMVTVAHGATSVGLASPVGALPAPRLSGDTATYADVLPGVDLELTADVDGYSQVLVVKNARAAANPKLRRLSFGLTGGGATLKTDPAGNLRATDKKGAVVLNGSTPLMWDATAQAARKAHTRTAPASPGASAPHARPRQVTMPAAVATGAVTITPNQQVLTGPDTVYPVYIDPGLTVNRAGYAVVSSASPDTTFWNIPDDAYVGSWDGGVSKYRSFFSYDLTGSPLPGKFVTSATLNLTGTYASSCTPTPFEVWSTAVPSSTSTWNNQPDWYSKQSTSSTTLGGSAACPAGPVAMDVTSYLQAAAASGWNGMALGLRASDESDPNGWKRFANNPTLTLTYTDYPTAAELSTSPATPCTTGTNRPYLNTATPQLQARITDPEGAQVRAEFAWSTIGGTAIGSAQPTPGRASGQTQSTTVPAGAFANGGSYSWKVRGFDGTAWGPWSTPCEFTVDTAAPTTGPTVSSATYPADTWAGTTGTTGTFSFNAAGAADAAAYVYGLDADPATVVNAGTLGGSATISLTPAADGPHVLKVQTRDRAGNLSPITSYAFLVGTGAVTAPAAGTQTAGKVTLSGRSKSTSSGITYQWRRGDTDAWTTVPAGDVTTATGGAVTWPVATTGSGAYPNLVWNAAQTVNNAEAGPDPLNGPVQIRASFSGTTTGTSSGVSVTLDRNRSDAASTGVGPGEVNLLTGNYALTGVDVETISGLGLHRTFNSRRPADIDPLFGPGWISGIEAPDAGTYNKLTVTGGLAQVGLADGTSLGFTKKATTSTGATFTGQVGIGAYALTYTTTGDTYQLVEPSGDIVTFARQSSGVYTPTALTSAGLSTSAKISWETVTVNGATVTRPTAVLDTSSDGINCTTPVRGCRRLNLSYATATTATSSTPGDFVGRVKQVTLTAWDPALATPAMRTVVLTQYAYDSTGRLQAAWNPALDYLSAGVTTHVATKYTYNTDGTISTLTPAGEAPWQFTYTTVPGDTGAGRLYKVTRSAGSAGTSVETIVYNVKISGAGAPVDMAANAARWGQSVLPVDATAVYPGDIVPDGNPATGTLPTYSDDDRITVTYMDGDGRMINRMYPGGTLDATWYDSFGNVVRQLDPDNLAETLYAWDNDTAAAEAAVARRESTEYVYSADGQRLLESLAPERNVVLADWDSVRGRTHTTYAYDEGAPSGVVYNLVTTQTTSIRYVDNGASLDADKRVTARAYDWPTRELKSETIDPTGLALTTRYTYDSTSKQITSVTTPAGDATGTTPSTRRTVYYRTGTGSGYSECDNRPEWAGLACRVFTGGQPAGTELPTTVTTYDIFGQVRSTIEKNSTGTLRTTTYTTDGAGRRTDVEISSAVGTALEKRHIVYAPATGREAAVQTLNSSGTVTGAVTSAYDTLGRRISYTDADGNTSTTTYDLLSRPATINDGKGTQTLTYGASGEYRGRLTKVVDSQAGTFTATYNKTGEVIAETRPDGVTVNYQYDETGLDVGREYVMDDGSYLYYDYAGADAHGKNRWDASSFSNSGFGYDNAGRITDVRQDTLQGCALRTYTYDRNSNRTKRVSRGPDSAGLCQDSNPATTQSWSYDAADRLTSAGYSMDAFGRTLAVPAGDGTAGATGDTKLTYFTNDLTRTVTQGATQTTYVPDVVLERYRSHSTTTGGTTVNTVNHYSDETDSPAWVSEGSSYTRTIRGVVGFNGTYASATNQVEWPIVNLHGDVVAIHLAGAAGLVTTRVTDENGQSVTGAAAPRYGYLGAHQRATTNAGGLITMGVRLYNPATARFLSTDPVYGGNDNAYEYCRGDVVNCTDLSGMESEVTVPALYIYKPSLGSLHDFCTKAPDSYFRANFRGPCARHDMCYERPGKRKAYCDSTFHSHLMNNCRYAYGRFNPMRQSCYGIADKYYLAVVTFGDDDA
ncbi:RHS repeat-associated core domain-containing protein [Actinoplanes teichomyceticus]|uniref:RHS repeat-associated protein n=1 Tax=Actinoplanes teichomyceticus TaxID=1867 RepID=A0A561WKB5_ACTTI|nr:RHS repeat-associated core domain-containing protein [Actinoplanes teichomyceticus]TWG24315.1 RHS repeat-associated protein [Actinoplanes teichomyceticus]GIF12835.1 hypothetical protein Ate01nite_28670 [Actinoplanes teichomyceticus]